MRQVSFDTHAAARKLQDAGHASRQAEAIVEVVSDATAFNMRMFQTLERIRLQVDNHMATKSDLAGMATKAELAEVKEELREMRHPQANLREDVREVVRSELAAFENQCLSNTGSMLVSLVALVLATLSSERVTDALLEHALPISLALFVGVAGLTILSRGK